MEITVGQTVIICMCVFTIGMTNGMSGGRYSGVDMFLIGFSALIIGITLPLPP